MQFTERSIQGAFRVDVVPVQDDRGRFARAWCAEEFATQGLTEAFVQANLVHTHRAGTVRGLHYQVAPHEEAKYIRCIRGAVYDVILDLRPDSPTYLQWHGETLTGDSQAAFYVPSGCAHGYQTLTDDAEVFYQVSTPYSPGAERGICYDDPTFDVEWPHPVTVVSEKDQSWASFDQTQHEALFTQPR
jgi:dTDP-4-dehydrorhamnose 3,5-epimerase